MTKIILEQKKIAEDHKDAIAQKDKEIAEKDKGNRARLYESLLRQFIFNVENDMKYLAWQTLPNGHKLRFEKGDQSIIDLEDEYNNIEDEEEREEQLALVYAEILLNEAFEQHLSQTPLSDFRAALTAQNVPFKKAMHRYKNPEGCLNVCSKIKNGLKQVLI